MRTTMTMRLTQSVRGICFYWCGFVTLDFRYGFVQRHHHYQSDSVGFSTFSPFELLILVTFITVCYKNVYVRKINMGISNHLS